MPYTLRFQRVLRAPPERVFRAFIDPAALAKWNAPDGFTATVHEMDARPGGLFRMSFTNFSAGQTHHFGGEFRELVPNEKIVATDRFDSPHLPGELVTTTLLKAVGSGTELNIEQAGLPDALPPDGCILGWQQSLELLARLVEPEIPGE